MTVKELKALLDQYPDDLRIATSLHSEYVELDDRAAPIELFENGGYLSRPYRDEDRPKARTWLLL
jgi:hypothetical protein